MKIFVSSRMVELAIERKTAVDSLHFAGHTPLYIEKEPEVKDQAAKYVMDSMIKDAEALLLIYYLSEGTLQTILSGNSPIMYEFEQFRKHHPDGKIMLFRKTPDPKIQPSNFLLNWFNMKAEEAGINIIGFSSPQELAPNIYDKVSDLALVTDERIAPRRAIIRYSGPDYMELLLNVTEVLFSKYKMNIDYISFATKGGFATLFVQVSTRGTLPNLKELRYDVLTRINQGMAVVAVAKEVPLRDESLLEETTMIRVDEEKSNPIEDQYYVELRTIDTPGQIYAICKVLLESNFHIDELQLKPTPPEFERQTTMIMSMSQHDPKYSKTSKRNLIKLEMEIDYLIGVRSYSIKYVPSKLKVDENMVVDEK